MIPAGNYVGQVLSVNTLEYSVLVKVDSAYGNSFSEPIAATPLNIHGGSSAGNIGISMPEIGSLVIVLVPQGMTVGATAYILGYAREPSRRQLKSESSNSIDPVAEMLEPVGYFRGEGPDDILPGDFIIQTSSGGKLEVNSSGAAKLMSSEAVLGISTVFGKSYTEAKSNSSYSECDLYTFESTADGAKLEANVNSSELRNVFATDGNVTNDTVINLGGKSAFGIEYSGSKIPAIFQISKTGEILIRGSKVTIDSETGASTSNSTTKYPGDLSIVVEGKYSIESGDLSIKSKSNIEISAIGNVAISSQSDTTESIGGLYKKIVSGPSVLKQGPSAAIAGLNDGMVMECSAGSAVIKSGSLLPGISTISKPQIRLEALSGGDIILHSQMSAGGAGVTGAVVLSSAMPASITGAGGAGNYGIALNSPLCMLGNYPAIDLTLPSTPNMFLPPVPIIGPEPVTKAVPLLTALTALAAVMTEYPPTTVVGAAFSAALGVAVPLIPTRSVFAI